MHSSIKGLVLGFCAVGLFSLTGVMAKLASADFHILQILFFRQMIVFISILPFLSRDFPAVLKTKQPFLHGVRLLGAFTSLALGLWAISVLPLTTAVVLMFSQTFFVVLLAHWYLGEKIGLYRMGAICMGFVGVVIVARPETTSFINVDALIAIGAATGASVALVCVRKLSQVESTATLLSYQAIFVGLLAGIPMFWFWKTPNVNELIFLLSMGGIATLAQWVGIKALRFGEASIISSIKYTELVFASIFGFWIFDEIPDAQTLIGASVIILSGLLMIHREYLKIKSPSHM